MYVKLEDNVGVGGGGEGEELKTGLARLRRRRLGLRHFLFGGAERGGGTWNL